MGLVGEAIADFSTDGGYGDGARRGQIVMS